MIFRAALFGSAVLLSACASNDAGVRAAPPAPSVPESGSLPAQPLAAGECGLFLWTQDTPRRFIFFSKAGGRTAEFMRSDTQQTLSLTRQGGSLFGQFMTNMDYQSAEGESVSLHLTAGERVEGGEKIASGRLEILNAGGWETVIPVSGLRACQPDPE